MKTLSGVGIVLIILSYLSTLLSPLDYPYVALLGLAYPVILLINLLSLLFWIFLKKRFAFYVVLAIFSGYNVLFDFVQFNTSSGKKSSDFSVLSYNLRLFDYYQWMGKGEIKQKIFDFLEEEDADVYCFQEFYYSPKNTGFETREPLKKLLETSHVHEHYTHEAYDRQYFGGATFSKYPIVGKYELVFSSDQNNYCMMSDIKIGDDTLRFYNVHLSSIRFQQDDYKFLVNKGEKRDWREGLRILSMLNIAFEKRTRQTNEILESINECPYPVILCGDFNDIPVSYCYREFQKVLKDSFREKGRGIAASYNGFMPALRIDYGWHDENFECTSFERFRIKYSDHYPIKMGFRFSD